MNIAALTDDVWRQLSPRKHVAGRRIVGLVVRRCVRQWPTGVLARCQPQEVEIVERHWVRSLYREMRQEVTCGVILTFLLSALISEIVRLLIQWWRSSDQNRLDMHMMQQAAFYDRGN
jgi:hypothetical protein